MMIAFIQRSAVLLLAFAFLFPAFGWGQVPDVGPGRCYANCDLPSYPSGGGDGGYYGGGGGWVLPNFNIWQVFTGFQEQFFAGFQERKNRKSNVYNDRGLAALDRSSYRQAIGYFRMALKYAPDDPILLGNLALAQNQLAIQLYNQGKYDEAARLFEEALKNRPVDQVIRENLAIARGEPGSGGNNGGLAGTKNRIGQMIDNIANLYGSTTSPAWDSPAGPGEPAPGLTFVPPSSGTPVQPAVSNLPSPQSVGLDFVPPPGFSGSADSATVDLQNMGTGSNADPVVDIARIQTRPEQKGLHIKEVPLPKEAQERLRTIDPFGGTPFGYTRTMDLVLDAIDRNQGDLKSSVKYLQDRIEKAQKPVWNMNATSGVIALSYLEGLHQGSRPYAAQVDNHGPKRLDPAVNDSWDLLGDLTPPGPTTRWPGPKNPNRKEMSPEWKVKRDSLVQEALREGNGNLEKGLGYLEKTYDLRREDYNEFYSRWGGTVWNDSSSLNENEMDQLDKGSIAWSAYYYLQGLQVFPDLYGLPQQSP